MKLMISLIFTSKHREEKKRKQERVKSTQTKMGDDLARDAVAMIGLLKTNEEKLEDQTKLLVKNRKDYARQVFSTRVEQWTPFHAFALRGCRKLIKLAVKSGVDANLQMGEPEGVPGKCTALHLAAHRGDVSILEVLIQNGADVNRMDSMNKTPIYYAARANNTLAVKCLKRSGADTSLCDEDVLSPLLPRTSNPFCLVLPFGCTGGKRSSFS